PVHDLQGGVEDRPGDGLRRPRPPRVHRVDAAGGDVALRLRRRRGALGVHVRAGLRLLAPARLRELGPPAGAGLRTGVAAGRRRLAGGAGPVTTAAAPAAVAEARRAPRARADRGRPPTARPTRARPRPGPRARRPARS